MARGYIFYITNVKDMDVCFNANYYGDCEDAIDVDYVKDCSEEKSKIPLEWLEKTMSDMGAVINREQNGYFKFFFRFHETEKVQQDYFRPKLKQLKKIVNELTLSDVVRCAPSLDSIVNNNYTDLITFEDESSEYVITVDEFIRRLQPGVTYYVYEKVLLIH